MKTYISILVFLICFAFATFAKTHSTIQEAFSKYDSSSTIARYNSDFLRKFVGDTIVFNFSDQYIEYFTVETPDTVWLKKRPKKNPEEGKHYILNKAYKGVQNDNTFLTPSSAINDKPFVVYSVKPHNNGEGCRLTLIDLDNLDLITANFPRSFKYDGTFTSLKNKRYIESLIGSKVFYSPDVPSYYSTYSKPSFTEYTVVGGDFLVEITKSNGMYSDYKLHTNCEIRLEGEDGKMISFSPLRRSEYASKNPMLLTQREYDDQFRGYSITSDVDLAIIEEEPDFPFTFKFIPVIVSGIYPGIYQYIEPNYTNNAVAHLSKDEIIAIGDVLTVGNTKYYKACFNGKAFFIKASDVTLDEDDEKKIATLMEQSKDIRDKFFKYQLAVTRIAYLSHLSKCFEDLNSYSKYGLAIIKWGVYDESNYTDGTGINFTFYNPTKQDIKYITITFQGYNAVDDPVGKPITRKCIGPIEPGSDATYEFEYAWFTDIVEYAKIRSIVIQYRNGTSKTISNPSVIMFSDQLLDEISKKNPVENLN